MTFVKVRSVATTAGAVAETESSPVFYPTCSAFSCCQAATALMTWSQVVAWKLGREFVRSTRATRFGRPAVSTDHSGDCARKSSCGTNIISANEI